MARLLLMCALCSHATEGYTWCSPEPEGKLDPCSCQETAGAATALSPICKVSLLPLLHPLLQLQWQQCPWMRTSVLAVCLLHYSGPCYATQLEIRSRFERWGCAKALTPDPSNCVVSLVQRCLQSLPQRHVATTVEFKRCVRAGGANPTCNHHTLHTLACALLDSLLNSCLFVLYSSTHAPCIV